MKFVVLTLATAPLLLLMHNGAAQTPGPRTTGGFAPLDYFENNCARCHGNYGSAYGETFGTKLNDEEMHRIVKEMAEGPGQAPLPEPELKIETDFHLALRDKKPFVAAAKYQDGELLGEATPGSTVTLIQGEKSTPIPLEGHTWRIKVPDAQWENACVRAEKAGQSSDWLLTP